MAPEVAQGNKYGHKADGPIVWHYWLQII